MIILSKKKGELNYLQFSSSDIQMIIKQIKYLFFFLLTILLGATPTHAKTEAVVFVPSYTQHFAIVQTAPKHSLQKTVQPNVGFLKEKFRFVVSESISAVNNCNFSEVKRECLVNGVGSFNFSSIKGLTGIVPTGKRLTNINFSQFTKGMDAGYINNLGTKYADDLLKVKHGLDKGGDLTEGIVSQALRNDGYTVIDDLGKYGSNNGYDVVAFKGSLDNPTEILIVEGKQFKQGKIAEFDNVAATSGYDAPSGLTINPNNPNTGLPTQMSDPWVFNHVLSKLENGTLDQAKLAMSMQNQSIVSKFVFAIDKSTGDGYFTKLGSFQ